MPYYLPIILGTARQGRQSVKVAQYVLSELSKINEVATEIIDVRDFRLPATDSSGQSAIAKNWESIVKRADGLIIVAPEYNHGYPGELKMMLDLLYRQYAKKPVAVCGVSAGAMGGVRMVEQLKLVISYLGMILVNPIVYFGNVGDLFAAEGQIKDQSYQQRLAKMFEELLWWVKKLKN